MKQRILIIEDQEEIALVMRDFLADNGFSVQVATTGNQAMAKLKKFHFDILVTDFKLPDIDGGEVARCGKEMQPGLKILFVTGYKTHISKLGLGQGDVRLLEKPCRPGKILEEIHTLSR